MPDAANVEEIDVYVGVDGVRVHFDGIEAEVAAYDGIAPFWWRKR